MTSVLVIGGYGGFGGRLSRTLSRHGHDVLVGGRSLQKAAAFCEGVERARPVRIDRTGDVSSVLAAERPDIVVDASGPFQHSGYDLVEACIAARIAYLDLADARGFVTGIARHDEAAKAAGIPVIAGASSVPALSGAVIGHLAAGIDRVTAIEIAISASSRAAAGNSVAEAILGGVGQAFNLWQGRRWQVAHGWQSMRPESFALSSGQSLNTRLVALADVPDLGLLPLRFAGVSAVSFRAGTESGLANTALWLASWAVRWGMLRSLSAGKNWLLPAQRLTALWGGDRSGMIVRVFGFIGERRVERRWSLIAETGDGPEIPTLAAALLVGKIARGEVAPGARDAGEALTLREFEPLFAQLAIKHATIEIAQPNPLYRRVMGAEFDRLAPALRRLHGVLRDHGAQGRGVVERGRHPLTRLIATVLRFPKEGEHALHVHFRETNGAEHWTRDFGGQRFSSVLRERGSQLIERFGPLRFHFTLRADDNGGLAMEMRRWSFFGLPLPLALAPRSPAREWEADGLFHFDVPIDVPLIGRVIHYHGWLGP